MKYVVGIKSFGRLIIYDSDNKIKTVVDEKSAKGIHGVVDTPKDICLFDKWSIKVCDVLYLANVTRGSFVSVDSSYHCERTTDDYVLCIGGNRCITVGNYIRCCLKHKDNLWYYMRRVDEFLDLYCGQYKYRYWITDVDAFDRLLLKQKLVLEVVSV